MTTSHSPRIALNQNTYAYQAFTRELERASFALHDGQRHHLSDLRNLILATAQMSHFWDDQPLIAGQFHYTTAISTLEKLPISDYAKHGWVCALNAFYDSHQLTEDEIAAHHMVDYSDGMQDWFKRQGHKGVAQFPLIRPNDFHGWQGYLQVTLNGLLTKFNPNAPKVVLERHVEDPADPHGMDDPDECLGDDAKAGHAALLHDF